MNDFETELQKIIYDQQEMTKLLALEKKRRGLAQDALVFVGMANVAKHWWCTQQAVFKSRHNELEVFSAYLFDRLAYSHRLGLITKMPTTLEALLVVGSEISWSDIERLLSEENAKVAESNKFLEAFDVKWHYTDEDDKNGERTRIINPSLPVEEKVRLVEEADALDIRVIDLEQDPMRRGVVYEEARAQRYGTIRWTFSWGRYSIIGIPDGLSSELVYEYKTTENPFLLRFMKPVAFAQADIYGYFFRRQMKRVQILILEDDITETFEEAVSASRAEETLKAFARVDASGSARPKAWKCRDCEFREACPICQSS